MGLLNTFFKRSIQKNKQTLNETLEFELHKDNRFICTENKNAFKIIRVLTEEQKICIEKSTILLRTGQLYMHYWTDDLICVERDDPEWQNKVIFFWKAEEPFPKKSLPKEFETFKKKFFLFKGDTSKLSFKVGQAIPWFGMPGLGEKYFCEIDSLKMTIPELYKLNLVEYVENIELTNNNLNILTERNDYLFLINDRITVFKNGSFYLEGKPISIDLAYSIGGIDIVKRVCVSVS